MQGSGALRAAVVAELEKVAQQAAAGEDAGSSYLALAERLHALAAHLRAVDAPRKRWWQRLRGR